MYDCSKGYCTVNCAGVGVGEGDSDSGVHVDDGSSAVGALDYLVPQTVCSALHYIFRCDFSSEGDL